MRALTQSVHVDRLPEAVRAYLIDLELASLWRRALPNLKRLLER